MRLPDTATRLLHRAGKWAEQAVTVRSDRPQLAPGVELIGEYRDSGYKEAPYIVRRRDGQVIQLPRLLFLIASHADGTHTPREIAAAVSTEFGRRVSADDVLHLFRSRLHALGLVAHPDGSCPPTGRVDPLLALRFRAAVVPARAVRRASSLFQRFFHPAVVGAALSWLVLFDVWLFADHGIGRAVQQVVMQPQLVLGVLGLIVLATAWHELGHASACRYGGATPGAVGVGIYLVWPAFYTDVTDAYRLDRPGRLRTDLGGVYFNALFILALGGAYFVTGFEPLLAVVALQHAQVLQQFLPFVRLDGYYVITDLVGVPDVMSRVRPILASLVPGRSTDPRISDLKPWVRITVTVYVLALVIVLSAMTALIVVHSPRYFATASGIFELQLAQASSAVGAGHWLEATVAGLRMLMVLLPAIGMSLMALRLLRLSARVVSRRLPDRPRDGATRRPRPALAFGAGAAIAVVIASLASPPRLGGDYDLAATARVSAADDSICLPRHSSSKRCRRRLARRVAKRRRQSARPAVSPAPAPQPAQEPAPPPPPEESQQPASTTQSSTPPPAQAPATAPSQSNTTTTGSSDPAATGAPSTTTETDPATSVEETDSWSTDPDTK